MFLDSLFKLPNGLISSVAVLIQRCVLSRAETSNNELSVKLGVMNGP